MNNKILENVKVSIETSYQEHLSDPDNNHYLFAYKVNIENESEKSIQLMSRHWDIIDSDNIDKAIHSDEIIGKQPIIEPGDNHEYVSICKTATSNVAMSGHYCVRDLADNSAFYVTIPQHQLVVSNN